MNLCGNKTFNTRFDIKLKRVLNPLLQKHYICNMNTAILIHTRQPLVFDDFLSYLEIPSLVLDFVGETPDSLYWYFHRKGISTTLFAINYHSQGTYEVCIDNLASYEDLKFFPYLVDSLAKFLQGEIDFENIYEELDENWIEETIADEVAYLKATLTILPKYFLAQPVDELAYVSLETLRPFGVNLHSSTPRIYGYMQYLMRHHLLPCLNDWDEMDIPESDEEIEVDIPQHEAIGRVKSWQLDGSETYETYSQEDVEHLLALASEYKEGKPLHGVVLNDIGTLHQEGIGIPVNGEEAIHWFKEAHKQGDKLYAPTNLGDLYRKGYGTVKPCLKKAFEAYQLSIDPYAHYRLGQAYEEGWTGTQDMKLSMKWYKQAAEEGHHLAIKRLKHSSASSKAGNC